VNNVFVINSIQQIKQQDSESMDNFYMRVKEEAALLDIANLSKEQLIELFILAQLVYCCTNNMLKKKALKNGLSFEDSLATARALERVDHQVQEIGDEQ
jgi:hypothetical protein